MAVKFESSDGKYDKTVQDSDTQDKKKFTSSYQKPTDNLKKPSQKANDTKYGGKNHPNP